MPTGKIELKRWFGNRKIVDAKKALRVNPTHEDIKKATPNDPNKCVFSRACQRELGSKAVLFLGTVAYIDRGNVVERYVLPTKARTMIQAFDAGYKVKPGTRPDDFSLCAPGPTGTLAALRRKSRQYEASGMRAKNAGTGKKKKKHRIQNARLIKFHQMVKA